MNGRVQWSAFGMLVVVAGCSLVTDLDGLSGDDVTGNPDGSSGGPGSDARPDDGAAGSDVLVSDAGKDAPFDASIDTQGLRLRLSADSLTLNNSDRVATWGDQSNRKNDAVQATVLAQPLFRTGSLNGLPVVRFNAGCSMATVAHIGTVGAGDRSIVAVLKLLAYADLQPIAAFGTTSTNNAYFSLTTRAGPQAWYFAGGSADSYSSAADANWHVHTVTYDGTNVTWWVDGAVLQNFPFAVSLDTAASPLLMAAVADYAELIVYDTVLTATQRQTLTATLKSKYALF